MTEAEVLRLSAFEIAGKVNRRELSAARVVKAFLERIRALDGRVKAFVTVLEASALKQAAAADRAVADGKGGRLAGVPIALKDNIQIAGERTTCSSKILDGYVSPYDATVTERLRAAGAVFIGKTNLDEFAMGSSTENSAFFTTRNPWDLTAVPGGSSGGSAAAVAARMVPVALGSDTGGSIRQPAALCGVVGLKPTYGRVSRYGLVAFASSLDQIGPIARNVRDAALVLSVIEGRDARDATSADVPAADLLGTLDGPIKGLRVGVPKEAFMAGLDPEVETAARAAIARLEDLGAIPVEVSLPNMGAALSVYYIIAPSEASANLARFDGIRYGFSKARSDGKLNLLEVYERSRGEGFGPEVKRRIMLGTYSLSSGYYDAYYAKAQRVRTLIRRDFERAFAAADLILTPTAPTPAFKIGEKASDALLMYLSDVYTIPCNLAGLSGISVPAGFSKRGLPIGVQFMGRPFEEDLLLRASRALERSGLCPEREPSIE